MATFQPLSNVTVIDLTRLLPGPYGTQLLGDLGAEVIKVEEPGVGDYLRSLGSEPDNSMSHYFAMLNRNKKSVTLDLKTDQGRDVFLELAEEADVVVESFRPGVVERLGVDYETVQKQRRDIVYCSLSGYGQTGPYSQLSGHDINYVGVAGILGLNRPKDGPPFAPGTTISDLAAGTFLALSAMAALHGDDGEYIDISMTDVATTWTLPYVHRLFAERSEPPRERTRHQRYPSYGVYRASDGEYVAIGAIEEQFWTNLCEALDLEEHVEHHQSPDEAVREVIHTDLQDAFRTRPSDKWVAYLRDYDVPVSPVNDIEAILTDDHIQDRGVIVDHDELGTQFRFPVRFADDLDEFRRRAPTLGEHTDEVLSRVGRSEEDIEMLHERGVL